MTKQATNTLTLKEILDRRETINQIIEDLEYERSTLNSAVQKFLGKNKLFCPMEDLSKYKGKEIVSVVLIDDKNDEYVFEGAEIVEVDKNGYFYLSDFNDGIIEYDEEKKSYVRHFHFCTSTIKFVGFRDLILGSTWDESSQKKIKKSFTESLIKSHLDDKIKIKDIRKKEPKTEDLYI